MGRRAGEEYRGYAAGSRYLVAHGGVADMCVLGEPTEQRIVLGHYGSLWMRLSTRGPFIHTAFSGGRSEENSIVRMRDVLDAVLEWIPSGRTTHDATAASPASSTSARSGAASGGASRGRRTAPTSSSTSACRRRCRWRRRAPALDDWCAAAERFPEHGVDWEIYVTAPGAEIEEGHELVARDRRARTRRSSARRPSATSMRWFSDASVLTRYGIATVNYGTSSGLPGRRAGENLEIHGLVQTADVYARRAQRVCG